MTSNNLNGIRFSIALLVLWVGGLACVSNAQQVQPGAEAQVPLSDAILGRVPSDYRQEARMLSLTDTQENQKSTLESAQKYPSDNVIVNYVVWALAQDPRGLKFLLSEVGVEPDGKLRLETVRALNGLDYRSSPEVQTQLKQTLEGLARSDANAGVSLEAIRGLRDFRRNDVNQALSKLPDNFNKIDEDSEKIIGARIESAKKAGDMAGVEKLGKQETIWETQTAELALPGFLEDPPPIFSLKPTGEAIRVLAFGDFGTGSPEQKQLAAAMVRFSKAHPFDFGLTLGDNFYGAGADSPSDPRWQTEWEQLYDPLRIKFYAVLGNHDVEQPDAPAAEILYSAKSPTWRMPATYYTFAAGPVQFFAVNTNQLDDAQLAWLDTAISQSKARWKVVYGHHTLYSSGRETKWVVERLLPLLKNRVDLYLCGHDHNLQELQAEDGVHFFVSGGGGADLDDVNPAYGRAVFEDEANGFTVLDGDGKRIKVTFVGIDGKELYSDTITK